MAGSIQIDGTEIVDSSRNLKNITFDESTLTNLCIAWASVDDSQTLEASNGLSYSYTSSTHTFTFTSARGSMDYSIVATFKRTAAAYAAFASITAVSNTGFSVKLYNTAANVPAYGITVAVFS
jgi:hypothetical protein